MTVRSNSRLQAIVREPALIIDAVETLLVLFVSLGANIHGDQQTYIVAFVIALAGLIKGFSTRPFPVSVIPDFTRAGLVLAVSFGLNWFTNDQIALIATFTGTLMTLLMRGQITPTYDPVVDATGSGAGPVTRQPG